MRIAFFIHCFFPDHFYGTETYTLDLAKHYQSWGNEVTVVSAIFQGEPKSQKVLSRYEHEGVSVVAIDKNYVPHSRVKETYYQPEMGPLIERVLDELRPDLIHVTHLINHTAVLLEVAGRRRIPVYATFTDFFGFCANNKLEGARGNLCAGPSPSRSNCVACYIKDGSRSARAPGWIKLAARYGAINLAANGATLARRLPGLKGGPIDGLVEDLARRPDTLRWLYNTHYKAAIAPTIFLKKAYIANDIRVPMQNVSFGVDIDRAPKPSRRGDHVPVVGYIGQIAPHKGTDLLIEAFGRMPTGSAELRIYGPADQSPEFMDRITKMASGRSVSFMGTYDKSLMANVLRDMDLLVIPSRWYENSPLVLLNALATHTPVLVSNVDGMTEFVVDGVNGMSFERGSVSDLERKLRALLKEKGLLAAMSATTSYVRTTETMARDTWELYST